MTFTRANMFRNGRQVQRWASRVLLVWLFGIAAGVANACLATDLTGTDGGHRFKAGATAGVTPVAAAVPMAGLHHGSPAAQGDSGQPGGALSATANCLDFCEQSSLSLPTVKAALDGAGGVGLPPPAVSRVVPVADGSPGQFRARRVVDAHSPPITIAFLRLAL